MVKMVFMVLLFYSSSLSLSNFIDAFKIFIIKLLYLLLHLPHILFLLIPLFKKFNLASSFLFVSLSTPYFIHYYYFYLN
jgi:hypothetical protein